MLAEEGGFPVPADLEARTAPDQQLPLLDRAAEHAGAGRGFGVGAPDKEADIEAPRDGAIQHVEQWAPAVGKEKVVRIEGHREPDTVACLLDRVADPTCDRRPIDQHAYPIAGPCRVWTRRRAGNVRPGTVCPRHKAIGAGTSSALSAFSFSISATLT